MDGVLEDITERKNLEEQLIQAQKMEAIGTLAGGIAHDFNNILTAIIGYGSLLRKKAEKDVKIQEYIDPILLSADRASILIRSLLAFSRKQELTFEQEDLNNIMVNLISLLLRIVEENIELKISPASRELPVIVDIGQIEQILMNLVTNARDAMPDGGIISIETSYFSAREEDRNIQPYIEAGQYALLQVSDTGMGMDKETQQRIFEPFFSTKEVGKGTGLGLAMTYGIIKQHNGYINVYSEPGKGTTFRIYLPLLQTEIKEPSSEETKEEPVAGRETVLLAEDDTAVRALIKNLLAEHGYEVIDAVDGKDAMDKFSAHKDEVQFLILDVIMPKKDGKSVFEEIRKVRPDIKALFISGYTADVMRSRGMIEEGLNFASKPIVPAELLKKIRAILDKRD
jgi:nitrogen-specific signal transduction histidine kinase/CheY-like chemotaxis protein